MSFTPDYHTNVSINGNTDPLSHNQSVGRIEDIQWSNSFESSEYNSELFLTFIIYGVFLNIVGVFGIIGNIISIIILSRPQMKSSINYLLIALAGCDTVFIIAAILLFGLPSIYGLTGYLMFYTIQINPLIFPVGFGVAMISQMMSVYLTLGITLERFIAVCQPLRARSLCTIGRAQFYIIIVLIFSILYNITRFWEFSAEQYTYINTNQSGYTVKITALCKNIVYISVYDYWMYLVFLYGLPFTVLAWFNSRIYMQVRRANQERQSFSRNQKNEIALATMLLCMVIVFLLCNLLPVVNRFHEAFRGGTIGVLTDISDLMVIIYSSVNFIIYMIFGEKFKRLFFKLFFPCGLRFCSNLFRRGDCSEQINHTTTTSRDRSTGPRYLEASKKATENIV